MKNQSLFWDKTAKKYAAKSVPSQEIYERKLEFTREIFSPESKVLEIGCGTGTTALIQAPYVNHITATDFSCEMIKIAKTKVQAQQQSNIEFVQEAISDMNYPFEEFDVIMAHSVLHLVESRDDVLEKIYSSLKQGGYFVTTTGCVSGALTIFKPLWYLGFLLGKLPYIGWFSKRSFIKSVTDAGFTIEKEWNPTKVDVFLIAKKI